MKSDIIYVMKRVLECQPSTRNQLVYEWKIKMYVMKTEFATPTLQPLHYNFFCKLKYCRCLIKKLNIIINDSY